MRVDELPQSELIEDRRGSSGLPVSRGGIGIGTVVVLGLIGWALGIDPRLLIGGAEMMSRSGGTQQADTGSPPKTGAPSDQTGRFVSAVLGSTEVQWTDIFAKSGNAYKPPTLVMFSGATRSGCGAARNPRWGRSIVRWTKRSISTQVFSRTSSDGFVPATSAAKPASSRRPT